MFVTHSTQKLLDGFDETLQGNSLYTGITHRLSRRQKLVTTQADQRKSGEKNHIG